MSAAPRLVPEPGKRRRPLARRRRGAERPRSTEEIAATMDLVEDCSERARVALLRARLRRLLRTARAWLETEIPDAAEAIIGADDAAATAQAQLCEAIDELKDVEL